MSGGGEDSEAGEGGGGRKEEESEVTRSSQVRSSEDSALNITTSQSGALTEAESHEVKTPGSSLADYEFCLGLWQRTNLEFYSEVIHVFYDENRTIVFEQLVPSDSAGLQRLKFLTISLDEENQVVTTQNLRGLTSGGTAVVLREEEDGEIRLRIEVDNKTGPDFSYLGLLRSFNKTQDKEYFQHFVLTKLKQNRSFCFQPLMTPRWAEKYHGDFRSESSILEKLKPGLFSVDHRLGQELVHLRDGQGVQITGNLQDHQQTP